MHDLLVRASCNCAHQAPSLQLAHCSVPNPLLLSQEQEVSSAQKHEPEEVPSHAANSIDLVFVVDVTGSMARALLAQSEVLENADHVAHNHVNVVMLAGLVPGSGEAKDLAAPKCHASRGAPCRHALCIRGIPRLQLRSRPYHVMQFHW